MVFHSGDAQSSGGYGICRIDPFWKKIEGIDDGRGTSAGRQPGIGVRWRGGREPLENRWSFSIVRVMVCDTFER